MKKLIRFISAHLSACICIQMGSFLLLIVLGVLLISQNPSFLYQGFAVDAYDRIYIGAGEGNVKVYENSQEIGRVRFTSRGYDFTIEDGTKLFYTTGLEIYCVDLSKDFLHREDNGVIATEAGINNHKHHFESANRQFVGNGQVYTAQVTPCNCDIYAENGELLLALGNKYWMIAFVLCIVILFSCLGLTALMAIAWKTRM